MKKEKFNQLVKSLKSKEEKIAVKAVKDVRKEGDISLLPVLARLLSNSQHEVVKEKVRKVFLDLKDPRAAEAMTLLIADPDFEQHKSFLVGSCWQSNVDYSPYLSFFTELVIEDEFQTSFEALTVIEEMKGPFDENEVMASLDRIHEYLDFPTNENEALVSQLKEIVHRYENNISEAQEL